MFRIKTDIRQYKCETKDKVEKLIRNWVIRPTDLIYDADGKDWAPIGEHPAFVGLFGVLDEQEKNTPDTVVTARSPYTEDPEKSDNGVLANGVEVEEVTRMVGRPAVADSEAEDSRATDVFDQEEIAASLSADAVPAPPSAPDGVEPIVNDGEVTMMTERTLEMLKVLDDDLAPKEEPNNTAAGGDPPEAPEEVTGVRPRDPSNDVDDEIVEEDLADAEEDEEEEEDEDEGADLDIDDAADDDPPAPETQDPEAAPEAPDDAPDDGNDEGAAEDEEITGVRERRAAEAQAQTEEGEPAKDGPKVPRLPDKAIKDKVLESGPKLGRHDLPEELFATNEISSPEVQEQIKRLDELAELSEPSEPTKNEQRPTADTSGESGESGDWPARLDEDSGVDEAWDVIAEDLRTTEEMGADAAEEVATEEVARDNFDDDDDEWDEDTSEPQLVPAGDFVSDGYRISLPFPVRPTGDDIRLGMPQGRVSTALKDRTYPPPEPKRLNEIHRREFDLSPKPPRDHTWVIVVAVVALLSFIILIVATC